jgi:hypothetical protein
MSVLCCLGAERGSVLGERSYLRAFVRECVKVDAGS